MQCRECGASIASNVAFCPNCGVRQSVAAPAPAPAPQAKAPAPPAPPRPQANKPLVSQDAVGQAVARPSKAALPQAGETFANRYRVEKYLGLGALCNSYLCRDLSAKTGAASQEVVLKVMHARKAAEEGLPESFLFLAESVAKYDYKGIARIYDSGRHDGAPYYAMEWVGGVPLRLWLMERLNFENRVLPGLAIIVALLDAFEVIHERGCYGCLKPENVFVTLNGPVVTDFGVVGFLTSQEFEFNSYARRYLPYMAPEIRQDWGNLLPHSDFYSIGAILYEILVGRAPAAQLRLPSELSRIFGIEADEIILKSMAARPLDRFATVEAFKQAVLALQSSLLNARPPEELPGLPASAMPISAPQAHSSLDRTSDISTLHNPDEAAFDNPDSSREMAAPGRAPAGNVFAPQADAGRGEDPGARTLFQPRTDEVEGEHALSAFAGLGDRIVEEAHTQRRFAHPPQPIPPGAEGALASHTRAWESPDDEAEVKEPGLPEEEEADPVPAWLWISIALAGSCMVVLSAYFGLMRGN
jgi:serine/threonine protein kinase